MIENERRRKLLEPDRQQLRLVPMDLEAMVGEEDPVRAVWSFVERLDLSPFYDEIASVEGEVGRPAIDPKILLALWIQATLDGVGSAREVARLCERHIAYQWICGGVIPNHHTLSDFRSNSAEALDKLLTESVAVLLAEGLVEMRRVAQDGMRVRASAGAGSFRRGQRLRELHKIAREQVERLAEEIDHDTGAGGRRQEAARRRAAESRAKRIERALKQLPEVQKRKGSNNGKKKSEPRVSTTDPDARVMKMADGGFRPAYNVHFVSDTESKMIVGAEVNNEGTDFWMMAPLADQIEHRHEQMPTEWLADGGCVTLDDIENLDRRGCDVFAPPRQPRANDRKPTDIRSNDSAAVAAWRQRMASDDGKAIYRQRGATAELVNAHVRHRGLTQFLVRGLDKVYSVVLLHALTHNLQRTWALQKCV